MHILKENEKALEKLGSHFLRQYYNARKIQTRRYEAETLENQEKVIVYERDGHRWYLNSRYDPDYASKVYAEYYEKIQDYSVLCVFGLSDGRAVRELLLNCNQTHSVLIYEPDVSIFFTAMEQFPLADILLSDHLKLVVDGINDSALMDFLNEEVTYQNHTLMLNCILPDYDLLYPQKAKYYIDQMLYYSKMEVFKKNTEIKIGSIIGDNILCNLPHLLMDSSVTELLKYFKNIDLGNVPAVIVSAGPSLDKNIRELKKIGNRAFIIGVDSALKALVREKIPVHMAVSVDPEKNPDVFSDERVCKYPYVVATHSLPLIAKKHQNRLFYEGGSGSEVFEEMIKEKTGKKLNKLKTGGSVATDALSLVFEMGFQKVILVGQDLAFTDGRGHVSGFERSEKEDQMHVHNRSKVEVEAMDGGMVETDIQMDSYRCWFEQQIQNRKDRVTVYNATEGGARIHGAVEMPLKKAIDQLCVLEMPFTQLIQEVPKAFTRNESLELAKEFRKASGQIHDLQNKLQDGVTLYEKLIACEKEGRQQTEEYRELLKNVYEMNGIEDREKYVSLIRQYAREGEYVATENIYTAEELSVLEIAERGRQMLEAYIQGCRVCMEHMETLLYPELDRLIVQLTDLMNT